MRAAIELYGSKWCPPCGTAKDIITATSPDSKGVKFTYVDVGEDPGYAMKQLPVLFVGDEVLEGPTQSELKAALDRLYAAVAPPPPEPVQPVQPITDTRQDCARADKPWLVFAVFLGLGFVGMQTLGAD